MSLPMNTAASPVKVPNLVNDDGQARWQAAAQIRREHPRRVVTWSAMRAESQARPHVPRRRAAQPLPVLLPGSSPPA